jgi:hypothetical protein
VAKLADYSAPNLAKTAQRQKQIDMKAAADAVLSASVAGAPSPAGSAATGAGGVEVVGASPRGGPSAVKNMATAAASAAEADVLSGRAAVLRGEAALQTAETESVQAKRKMDFEQVKLEAETARFHKRLALESQQSKALQEVEMAKIELMREQVKAAAEESKRNATMQQQTMLLMVELIKKSTAGAGDQ